MAPPPRPRGRPGDTLVPGVEISPDTRLKIPRMEFMEIQEDMVQSNLPITKELLRAPGTADVRRIYDHFISEIRKKRVEDMAQPAFGCLEVLDYQELYEGAIPNLHYLRELQKIFKAAQFEDFGLRDIHAPEKSRLHWHLCAILNFVKFRCTRLALFEQMTSNAENLISRERDLVEEKTRLERDIAKIEEARSAEEPEREKIRKELSTSLVEMDALHKQQQELAERTREVKAELERKTEKAATLKMKKMTLRQEVEAMRSKIVSSPTRVMSELDSMSANIEAEKENINSIEKRTRTLKMRTDALKKASQKVEIAKDVTDVCITKQTRLQDLKTEIQKRKATKSQQESEMKSIADSSTHLHRLIESIGTKLTRVCEQQNDIDTQNSENDKRLDQTRQEFGMEKDRIDALVDQRMNEIEKIEKRIEECVNSFSAEVGTVSEKQELVTQKFVKMDTDLQTTLGLIIEENEKAYRECKELAPSLKESQIVNSVQ